MNDREDEDQDKPLSSEALKRDELIVYGRALHSFTNRNVAGGADPRMDYHPSADRQSWAAALLFLKEAFSA